MNSSVAYSHVLGAASDRTRLLIAVLIAGVDRRARMQFYDVKSIFLTCSTLAMLVAIQRHPRYTD